MTRPLTTTEQQRFQGYFPNLNVNSALVSGESTPSYNCVSWTVGVTNRWLWPGPTIGHFDIFYRGFGFVRAGNGPIAAWGQSPSIMTHGNISGPGHGAQWESKCGSDLRIEHALNELTGASYGRVIAFYTQSLALAVGLVKFSIEMVELPSLTSEDRAALQRASSEVRPKLREAYHVAFAEWKETWFDGSLSVNSNPHSRAIGKAYDTLVALGPDIVPLLVESLADPENFFALQLYDAIQSNRDLIIQFESDDVRIYEGEQGRAVRVVKHWLSNR